MRLVTVTSGLVVALALAGAPARAERLKDLVEIEDVRSNPLVGYGLVVGLAGTGDDASSASTRGALAQLVRHLGQSIDPAQVKAKNVAVVIVTADLPPFGRAGATIDVTVSSLASAKSLQGGVLVATPLQGADGRVYALAQGSIALGGFIAEGASGSSQKKNHTTVGRIPGGAILEASAPGRLQRDRLTLLLREADFTTATRIATAIDATFGDGTADVRDPAAVVVHVPKSWRGKQVGLVAALESVEAEPDVRAKVVVDERTGTIVVGGAVTLRSAAIAYGGLTVSVQESQQVSQPGVLAEGTTVATPDTKIGVEEGESQLVVVEQAATISELAAALNALGLKPRDLTAVFQALRAAGALRAEIEVL